MMGQCEVIQKGGRRMARQRFQDTGKGASMGDYYYAAHLERHRDHFLVVLQALFDWKSTRNVC